MTTTTDEPYVGHIERITAELRFVADRYLKDGSGANFRADRCTGVSSDAMAWFGIQMRGEPQDHEYPADESDLAACERTYEMAPPHVQARMLPVLQSYRLAVASEAQERAAADDDEETPPCRS